MGGAASLSGGKKENTRIKEAAKAKEKMEPQKASRLIVAGICILFYLQVENGQKKEGNSR